jgi:hypothetical protein
MDWLIHQIVGRTAVSALLSILMVGSHTKLYLMGLNFLRILNIEERPALNLTQEMALESLFSDLTHFLMLLLSVTFLRSTPSAQFSCHKTTLPEKD